MPISKSHLPPSHHGHDKTTSYQTANHCKKCGNSIPESIREALLQQQTLEANGSSKCSRNSPLVKFQPSVFVPVVVSQLLNTNTTSTTTSSQNQQIPHNPMISGVHKSATIHWRNVTHYHNNNNIAAPTSSRRISLHHYNASASPTIDFFAPVYHCKPKNPNTLCFSCFTKHHISQRKQQSRVTIKYIALLHQASYLKYKWTPQATKYSVVSQILRNHGFRKCKSNEYDFNIQWGLHMPPNEYYKLSSFQRVNHWLGSTNLGRKDLLFINLDRMRVKHGTQNWSFFPKTYFFPHDRAKLIAKCNMNKKRQRKMWIVKPKAEACGRNISVLSNLNNVDRHRECLVQEYIDRPFTINRKKFDLRLYVLVTSYDPLTVYIYSTGLVRFASEAYSHRSTNIFAALTNYSLNKKSDKFVKNTDALQDDVGNKWTCTALRRWFKAHGIDDVSIWQQTYDIIVKTLISVEQRINALTNQYVRPESRNSCFEVYGYDILLDEDLVPHLIEVNIGPSLSISSPLDKSVKSSLIRNVLQLVGVKPFNRDTEKQKRREQSKLADMAPSLDLIDTNASYSIQVSKKTGKRYILEEKPISRTLKQLKALSNLDYLTVHDRDIILHLEEAYNRREDFIRLFPTRTSTDRYGSLFMETSYNNLLISLWMRESAERQKQLMAAACPFIRRRYPVKEPESVVGRTTTPSIRRRPPSEQHSSLSSTQPVPSPKKEHHHLRRTNTSLGLRARSTEPSHKQRHTSNKERAPPIKSRPSSAVRQRRGNSKSYNYIRQTFQFVYS